MAGGEGRLTFFEESVGEPLNLFFIFIKESKEQNNSKLEYKGGRSKTKTKTKGKRREGRGMYNNSS